MSSNSSNHFTKRQARLLPHRSHVAAPCADEGQNEYVLFAKQAFGFIHEWMLKGAGISIERGCFEA
jgi:hypothetical protein